MLNAKTALFFVERIEKVRADAEAAENGIFAELRAMPDYEENADRVVLEAIDLRAEARGTIENAETLIGSFDWVYDEAAGENRRKPDTPQ